MSRGLGDVYKRQEIEFKDEEELSRILGEMIQFDQGGQDEE